MRKKVKKRYWWLIGLIAENKFTVGAEIGCANGATTWRLLKYCNGLKLYAVDRWERVNGGADAGQPGAVVGEAGCEAWDWKRGEKIFDQQTRLYNRRLVKLKGDSVEMAEKVKNESLDFIFIDADHRYPAVIKDLAAWVPKLKPGGVLCGHDIHLPGVKKAVDEKLRQYEDTEVDHVWIAKKEDYEG